MRTVRIEYIGDDPDGHEIDLGVGFTPPVKPGESVVVPYEIAHGRLPVEEDGVIVDVGTTGICERDDWREVKGRKGDPDPGEAQTAATEAAIADALAGDEPAKRKR